MNAHGYRWRMRSWQTISGCLFLQVIFGLGCQPQVRPAVREEPPPSAQAGSAPPISLRNEQSFTQSAAMMLMGMSKRFQIQILGDLIIQVENQNVFVQIELNEQWQLCRQNPPKCEEELKRLFTRLADRYNQQPSEKMDIATVRIMLRSAKAVESIRNQIRSQADSSERPNQPIIEPFLGDLWKVYVGKSGGTEVNLRYGQIRLMHVDEKVFFKEARNNARRETSAPPQILKDSTYPHLGFIGADGSKTEASRLLFPDDWAQLGKIMKGSLLVCAPLPTLLVIGDSAEAETIAEMKAFIAHLSSRQMDPSATILRWTPHGWEIEKQ